ncbi:MAG: 23S rRNA (pseudouridine(1915)-N(3))-methyltransferase RlmH [Butyrivibrio sp.]|nr:23S rRNA (pseudouridine(1915)-N(3))-methyltransferase RlmH [Butyrivibrio sp.]
MTEINVVCVGRIKEKYWNDAISEYSKRLSRYCKLNIIEVSDEKTPDNAPEAIELQIKDKEGERILKKISDNAYVIALAIDGKKYTSTALSNHVKELEVRGKSNITFVIGGSLGLSSKVFERSSEKLSFSDMTYPHQMMRVILLEQIYRCYKISNGEPYHK